MTTMLAKPPKAGHQPVLVRATLKFHSLGPCHGALQLPTLMHEIWSAAPAPAASWTYTDWHPA